MTTQAGGPYLLRRIAARAGIGIWHHRGGVLMAAVVSVALGWYVTLSGAELPNPQALIGVSSLAGATPSGSPSTGATTGSGVGARVVGSSNDCADTAMAAIADKAPAAAQRAYQCMDPTFQQRVSEQTFIQQMQQSRMPSVDKLARVGDYRTAAGGTMVYYALDGGGQSVGYIVYLGEDGKVLKIE